MKENNSLVFTLSLENYSLEGVYQAAYAMLDRLYFYFDKKNAKSLLVEIKPKLNIPLRSLETLKGEFLNELLSSELRVMVARRTRKIREALIAQALIGASTEKINYTEDPLGIALPWEEKYGGEKKSKKIGH
ncbi:MAG: His-Xaa-Ser system protein HxsD [Elusimicrobia bacterium GWF2_52_66]|nr:MAG: His-Xaa-Ser system protein HxsD [Elusimicrobia bacterium GWA2_51_34]OGR88081.1 MAG: His-Xaa-Ser system protein HxsD [Elusimicrobia bacterium GWF2_52_66]HAF95750.1 His-Xaa-Ser system protein HxsD [Elusimicrobiota bacterium]HCE97737.1 His-Xaa-Ser system protein HxsD [Elusimicrobiota bacterium]